MSQLSLFGSLFDTPPSEKKPEEKRPAPKMEERLTESVRDPVAPLGTLTVIQDPPKDDNSTDEAGRIDSMGENGILPGSSDYPSVFDEALPESEEEIGLTGVTVDEEDLLKENEETDKGSVVVEESAAILSEPLEISHDYVNDPLATISDSEIIVEKAEPSIPDIQQPAKTGGNGSVIFDDGKISVKIKNKPSIAPVIAKPKKEKIKKIPQKRGRKSFKEIDAEVDLIEVPDDEVLFQKQYYAISVVAKWFRVNTSLLRFWENEFDILKPRKNRKGDRLFRPEDVKNLQLIYQLLRQKKYTVEGAKEYLKTNKKKADVQIQLTNTLQKMRSFLLDLRANLQ